MTLLSRFVHVVAVVSVAAGCGSGGDPVAASSSTMPAPATSVVATSVVAPTTGVSSPVAPAETTTTSPAASPAAPSVTASPVTAAPPATTTATAPAATGAVSPTQGGATGRYPRFGQTHRFATGNTMTVSIGQTVNATDGPCTWVTAVATNHTTDVVDPSHVLVQPYNAESKALQWGSEIAGVRSFTDRLHPGDSTTERRCWRLDGAPIREVEVSTASERALWTSTGR